MKKGFMLFTLLAAFSGFAQADDAAIQQTLAKMGIKSSDIQPAPVAGMKTVLTNSGVCTSPMMVNISFRANV